MKRILALILILTSIVLLVGCAGGDANNGNEAESGIVFDTWVEAIAGETLRPIHLNAEQIKKMEGNIKKLASIEGSLVRVCQIQANGVFAYVIECESEADALKIKNEREMADMYTKINGKTVVYGNNESINDLK